MTEPQSLRIASRGSQLALWQSESVRDELLEAHPQWQISIDVIRTTGDRILDVPLARIGDRGLFTKELDDALLDHRADLAVHSLKDIPTQLPEGLYLSAIGKREDPRDVLIGPPGSLQTLESLPPGAKVGTSSLRRRSQLKASRPDIQVSDIRGNLDTRLRKLDDGDYDAIVLAAAGVKRLGWSDRISSFLDADGWIPAVSQGALGIVSREGDESTSSMLRALNHRETELAVLAERAFLRRLEGGCQVPIGGYATVAGDRLTIDGFVSDIEGLKVLRGSLEGSIENPAEIGQQLAAELLARGAGPILDAIRAEAEAGGPLT